MLPAPRLRFATALLAPWVGLALGPASPASALSWTPSFESMELVVDVSANPPFTFLRDTDSDNDSSDGWSVAAGSSVSAGTIDSAASATGAVVFTEPDTLTLTFHSEWEADATGGGQSVSYDSTLSLDYWFTVPQDGVLNVSWDISFQGDAAGYDYVFGAGATGQSLDPGPFGGVPSLHLDDQWAVTAGELVLLDVLASPGVGFGGLPAIGTAIDATFRLSYSPVPEPGTLVLLGLGLAALARGPLRSSS